MTYEIERKILNGVPLNNIEVQSFLKYFCDYIRKENDINDPLDPNCRICYKTSEDFGRLMLMRFGCDVEKIDIKNDLGIPLTHYSNIIFFNIDGVDKAYLVDMTYSQFFGETIALDGNNNDYELTVYTEKVFGSMEKEPFVEELRKNGFVELNEEILKKYIDAFLDICDVNDKTFAYQNINKKLYDKKVNIKLEKGKVEKLQELKQELLETAELIEKENKQKAQHL